MDTFRKAFRRAKLPLAFSKGYNPHIKLALGQPLSVGMVGKAEYFDLVLNEKIDRVFFLNQINPVLPEGIKVLQAKLIPETAKSLQAVVNTAVYLLKMNFKTDVDQKKIINDFYNLDQIKIIRRRRNKKDRELDLKPMIYEIELFKPGIWKFIVSTGSRGNVRASELSRALAERYSVINDIPVINITRQQMLVKIEDNYYSPLDQKVVRR